MISVLGLSSQESGGICPLPPSLACHEKAGGRSTTVSQVRGVDWKNPQVELGLQDGTGPTPLGANYRVHSRSLLTLVMTSELMTPGAGRQWASSPPDVSLASGNSQGDFGGERTSARSSGWKGLRLLVPRHNDITKYWHSSARLTS
ncbi:hypothetical protein AB1N83_007849 [Pleurotus pulmonarius]